jgi:hypothetical protein
MYKSIHVQTFLTGSYAKHTSIRPVLYDGKRDVDIVIETIYTTDDDSTNVLRELCDVIKQKTVYSSAHMQSHSVGVELSGIEVDIVPVVTGTRDELYYIGDSKVNNWSLTDPKGHIIWSSEVNKESNGKYKPLVKMIKWWLRTNCPNGKKFPKGIAIEKIIADNLPDADLNTENYLVATMHNIVSKYKEDYTDQNKMPVIDDPSIGGNNLIAKYKVEDFKAFVEKMSEHLTLINDNGTSNYVWRTIFGNEFPNDNNSNHIEDISRQRKVLECLSVAYRQRPVWILPRGIAALINTLVIFPDGHKEVIENDGVEIPKDCELYYRAIHGIKSPYSIYWQIVNTGDEAISNTCLRGGFERSNVGTSVRFERTAFRGKHYVQCFIIKNGKCVAKSKEFIINVK